MVRVEGRQILVDVMINCVQEFLIGRLAIQEADRVYKPDCRSTPKFLQTFLVELHLDEVLD